MCGEQDAQSDNEPRNAVKMANGRLILISAIRTAKIIVTKATTTTHCSRHDKTHSHTQARVRPARRTLRFSMWNGRSSYGPPLNFSTKISKCYYAAIIDEVNGTGRHTPTSHTHTPDGRHKHIKWMNQRMNGWFYRAQAQVASLFCFIFVFFHCVRVSIVPAAIHKPKHESSRWNTFYLFIIIFIWGG